MRTLPRALTAAAVTGLLLGGLSAPAATAAPVSVQHAAVPASVTAVTGVAATAKKKAPSIAWTTIKRKVTSPYKGQEILQIPYLKGASSKATKAFNKEISRQFAALRKRIKTNRSYYGCRESVDMASYKVGGGIYKGRYASAALMVYSYDGCGGSHGWSTSADVTVDLKTGKLKGLSTFATAPKSKVHRALGNALMKKGAWGWDNGQNLTKPSAWYVSPKGVTYVYNPYVVGSYSEGHYVVTLPWKTVSKR